MIERKFIARKVKVQEVENFVIQQLANSGNNRVEIKRTPLGEKIIIYTSRPGLIVGRKGENVKKLTQILKTKYQMENPQIEIGEIKIPYLDPNTVLDDMVSSLEKFGPKRFKFLGYETLKRIIGAGAIGAEIVIGGVGIPGARAKSWRFFSGYLKKSGDVSDSQVLKAQGRANLKRGCIGIKLSILPPDLKLPDKIKMIDLKEIHVEEIIEEPKETKVKQPRKKETKKRTNVKKEKPVEGKTEEIIEDGTDKKE
ncbi:MAG: 30S ribosomal protein S3 [Candidatus Nanoarchaeia archaeon]|nr:30S ribosomal protein S3 [Candidatus Nanoarchaeia archaeon]